MLDLREGPVGGGGATAEGASANLVVQAQDAVTSGKALVGTARPPDLEVGTLVAGKVGAGGLDLVGAEAARENALVAEVDDGAVGGVLSALGAPGLTTAEAACGDTGGGGGGDDDVLDLHFEGWVVDSRTRFESCENEKMEWN